MIKFIEYLRKKAFWFLDFLKGAKTKAHYDEIKFIMENYNTYESTQIRAKNLHRLLTHATSSCTFYKPYDGFKDLSDFPIINKTIIKDKFKEFNSDKYSQSEKYEMSTSGSSGTPFKTVQDKNKKLRNTADTIYFKQKAGFEIGSRLYYVRKWLTMHKRPWLTTFMRNIVMVNVTEFTDSYKANFIKELENDSSTQVIISYSSSLRDICSYLDQINSDPIKNNLSCIIAMAEGLSIQTRNSLKKYFNAPVLLRYSNLENGILSLQLAEDNHNLQINCASYFIEILHPEKDEPVKDGEVGRIVITDIFNYCMPFIRYDTGDLGSIIKNDNYFNGSPAFTTVQGRQMDTIYDTSGNIQSAYIVFHLQSYTSINQFQFIQDGIRTYTLKLNMDKTMENEVELSDLFRSYLGEDAEIKIEYVNEIPQLSSGKRRLTVNNFYKKN
jgi:phenylacetate-CoA ligase